MNSPIKLLKHKLHDNNLNQQLNNKLTTFINPYSYLFFRQNINVFSRFNEIQIDGQSLVIILNFLIGKGKTKFSRQSFDMTSLAPLVFNDCIDNKRDVFFIGTSESNIVGFMQVIETHFPKLKISGYRSGYFRDDDEKENSLNLIVRKNPDVVVVGMGTPLQETFLLELSDLGWKGYGFTCGGFFHQTVERIDYYPPIFNKLNLRWLYRMIDEPKLVNRYLYHYPRSFALIIFDFLRWKFANLG